MSFSCPICLEVIKESTSNNSPQEHFMATQCGHVFHRSCIGDCLRFQSRCPSCNKECFSSQVIRLFPTGDEENERLIQDIQAQIDQKIQENSILQTQINQKIRDNLSLQERVQEITSDFILHHQQNENLKCVLENKQRELEKTQNECKIMGMDVTSKVASLKTLRGNCLGLKSELDEKSRALTKIETELENLKKGSCGPEQYEQSKERYRALLTRYEKLVDEKISDAKKLETLQEEYEQLMTSKNTLQIQYDTLLSQKEIVYCADSESAKADKEKYKKLLTRFEELTDKKNAIVHEKLKLEKDYEAYKKNNSSGDSDGLDQMKNHISELERQLDNAHAVSDNRAHLLEAIAQEIPTLEEKAREADQAKITAENLEKELAELKKDHGKVIAGMKNDISKLYNQKEKAVTELKNLRKFKTENASTITNLSIGSVDNNNNNSSSNNSLEYNELEKKYLEVKAARNRLIRETNKNKQKSDHSTNENKKLQDKIKKMEATIAKLNQDLKVSKNHQAIEDANYIMDATKYEDMIRHCNQLVIIANSCKR